MHPPHHSYDLLTRPTSDDQPPSHTQRHHLTKSRPTTQLASRYGPATPGHFTRPTGAPLFRGTRAFKTGRGDLFYRIRYIFSPIPPTFSPIPPTFNPTSLRTISPFQIQTPHRQLFTTDTAKEVLLTSRNRLAHRSKRINKRACINQTTRITFSNHSRKHRRSAPYRSAPYRSAPRR